MLKKFSAFIFYMCVVLGLSAAFYAADSFSLIPKKTYTAADFGIDTYKSANDGDCDGTEDQTDILCSAQSYVALRPKYKSKYYEGGYPDDEYGVCTDVIGAAMKGAGYDLMKLVNSDILSAQPEYGIEKPDKNIDFRRVPNLNVYFSRHALSLTTDINDIKAWQGGDIVVFPHHIGIVSDKRNRHGVTYIIHNAGRPMYEEDVIDQYQVIGHYRITKPLDSKKIADCANKD